VVQLNVFIHNFQYCINLIGVLIALTVAIRRKYAVCDCMTGCK